MSDNILTILEKKTPDSPIAKANRLLELQTIYKKIKPEIDELKADLLRTTQELDVYTLKTGDYTISRAKRVTPRVTNFEALKEDLESREIEVYTEEVFAPQMDVVFKQAINQGTKLNGLDALETEYISIRLREKEGGEKNE